MMHVQLCEALGENTSLTHLNLAYNKMREQGLRAVAAMLRTNSALRWLDLSGNRISGDFDAMRVH